MRSATSSSGALVAGGHVGVDVQRVLRPPARACGRAATAGRRRAPGARGPRRAAPPAAARGELLERRRRRARRRPRAARSARPRDRRRERVVELERAGAVAPDAQPALQRGRAARRRAAAAPARPALTVRDDGVARRPPRRRRAARRPTRPPRDQDPLDGGVAAHARPRARRGATSASASACMPAARERPAVAVAEQLQQEPERPLPAVVGGRPECCAEPASHAVARGRPRRGPVRAPRPTRAAAAPTRGRRGAAPAPAAAGRAPAAAARGSLSTSGVASGSIWSIAAAQPAPAAPSEAAVAATSRCSAIALPSSNGCAMHHRRVDPLRPSRSSSSSRIAGEAAVIGTNAAQWSCTKPGSVISADDVAPPGPRRMLEHA